MKYTAIFIIFLLISCKETKTKVDEIKEPIKERKDIKVPNLKYSSFFNGIRNETEYEEFYGNYRNDRFNSPKQALFLDGVSDYGKIYNTEELNPKKELTIALWYKSDNFKGNGNNVILAKPNLVDKKPVYQYAITTVGPMYQKIPGTVKFFISIDGKLISLVTGANVLKPNQWQHIIGTYDGKTVKLYVDGQLTKSRPAMGIIDVYDTDLHLGVTPNSKFHTPGFYDDLKVYDRAISDDEIKTLWNNQ
ncbi:MAG: LamG domain-containing protein [Winogradskyella sp.]|nr:MAG: LamG domain-containing protein [Winogradskyella sp.]